MKSKQIITIIVILAIILGSAVAFGQIGKSDKKNSNENTSKVVEQKITVPKTNQMTEMSVVPPTKPEAPKMEKALEDEIRNMAIPKSGQN